jgi:dimethylargininase
MNFTRAIVRPPSTSFAQGITSANLGVPDIALAQEQHQAYCATLERCGLSLILLEEETDYPDSTFVEDTAILTKYSGILTRPGAESRSGEVASIRDIISSYYDQIYSIEPPGRLDGGDICQVDNHFFIGISNRTNADGAQQLASILLRDGFSSTYIDLKRYDGLLHLKSGIAYLGEMRLVLVQALAGLQIFNDYDLIYVDQMENYAANCLRVNESVLVAAGFPGTAEKLTNLGYKVLLVNVSEFQKMDGGLSCLSLRF